MTHPGPLAACGDGVRRIGRAPLLVLLTWMLTLIVSVPLTLGVRRDVERQLGASLQPAEASPGSQYDWLTAFSDQASGASATLGPSITGFGGVLDNLSAFLDGDLRPIVLGAAGAVYVLGWTLLAGGIIDRLARDRALRAHAFGQACGGYFFPLLRLSLISALVYGVILGRLHLWLFDDLFDKWNEGLASDRTAVLIRFALYGVFALALAACNLWFDYAKVRLVVEDRASALGALTAAARFQRRQPLAVMALYGLDALLFVAVLAAYAMVAPGTATAPLNAWTGFLVGQLYIAARLAMKLVFWASAIALFQGRLAHAGYAARRVPAWPDSAAAEAVNS